MSTAAVPFSQLIQRSRETVAALESSPRRRLRLERRDGQDLILESAERAEAEDEALSMTGRLFFSLIKNDDGARALLLALPDVFPWVRFLPTGQVREFRPPVSSRSPFSNAIRSSSVASHGSPFSSMTLIPS